MHLCKFNLWLRLFKKFFSKSFSLFLFYFNTLFLFVIDWSALTRLISQLAFTFYLSYSADLHSGIASTMRSLLHSRSIRQNHGIIEFEFVIEFDWIRWKRQIRHVAKMVIDQFWVCWILSARKLSGCRCYFGRQEPKLSCSSIIKQSSIKFKSNSNVGAEQMYLARKFEVRVKL